MKLSFDSNWDKLISRMQQIQEEVPIKGAQWAHRSALEMDENCREHLGSQGRGGAPPPLSEMTHRIYEVAGEPDGSGITNHLTLEFERRGSKYRAILGIPEGQPSLVARVQEHGATIPVTDKMRGYMAARFGIFLRADTTHIQIPGREFWSSSRQKTRASALRRLKKILPR